MVTYMYLLMTLCNLSASSRDTAEIEWGGRAHGSWNGFDICRSPLRSYLIVHVARMKA
jgi:hypothetical protein